MILEVKHAKKSFKQGRHKLEVLRGISLTAERGEFISIMGPSGSGKSTLLQIMGGLDSLDSGSVKIENQSLGDLSDPQLSAFRRRKLGYVFQFFNLMPTLSALENVALPLLLDGQSKSEVSGRALELLDYMGLKNRAHHRPAELSGGEMQRVAIARALVANPLVILADEPTGNLDSKTGHSVLSMLKKVVTDHNQLLIMVTHDANAAQYGTRTIRIGDGQIESDNKS